MLKSFIFLFCITAFALNSMAQFKIGANIGAIVPVNGINEPNIGVGGYMNGRYVFAHSRSAIGIDLGFYSFGRNESRSIAYKVVPILASYEYYFLAKRLKPFVGAKAGVVNFLVSLDDVAATAIQPVFAFEPQAGLAYGLTNKIDLNLTLQYLYLLGNSSGGILPISVGLAYKLGE